MCVFISGVFFFIKNLNKKEINLNLIRQKIINMKRDILKKIIITIIKERKENFCRVVIMLLCMCQLENKR